jgi:hypothetical protein
LNAAELRKVERAVEDLTDLLHKLPSAQMDRYEATVYELLHESRFKLNDLLEWQQRIRQ